MFSRRVPADHSANRLSAAIDERRAAGLSLIDLTESNPTRCGFRRDESSLRAALSAPQSLRYEPHPQGLLSAREAVARYYAEAGVSVDPDSLFLTTGTSEAYTLLFKLLADPGDDVLVPTPGYPLLDVLTRLEAVQLVPYALQAGQGGAWSIHRERVESLLSTRTRAVVVVSPNNPTGSYLKRREQRDLSALCRRQGCALIVDEVFSDYASGEDPERVRTAAEGGEALTFTLNGFSKLVGLPQLKLGWIHVSGPAEIVTTARERLAFITDAFLSVSAGVQHAAPQIFESRAAMQDQILQRLRDNETALRRFLVPLPSCRLLPREGGWYGVVEIPTDIGDEALALDLLRTDGVLVHPGYFYDFSSGCYLVVSLLPPREEFDEGASRLVRRLAAQVGSAAGRSATGR